MDADTKARWVEALRSGKYTQGRGHLKQQVPGTEEFTYCCLGVLCEVESVPSRPVGSNSEPSENGPSLEGNTVWEFIDPVLSASGFLPRSFAQALHIPASPSVTYKGNLVSLAELNDDYEKDFEEIAALIEAQF